MKRAEALTEIETGKQRAVADIETAAVGTEGRAVTGATIATTAATARRGAAAGVMLRHGRPFLLPSHLPRITAMETDWRSRCLHL